MISVMLDSLLQPPSQVSLSVRHEPTDQLSLISKALISLGSRALACALSKFLGFSGGLALAIVFATSANASSSWTDALNSHSTSSSPSLTRVLFGSSEMETEDTGTSVNDRVARPVPPANPVASGEAEAGPSHVVPFPYDEDEVIGGDSVLSIQNRLLANHRSPAAEVIQWARIKAEDLFEVKVDIIRQMIPLDPEGDWLRRGARALENPRTLTGEESLEKLQILCDKLRQRDSETIFRDNVFRRRDNDAESIT
ncbi:uncharacterized protein LOC133311166 [Gastrolobium bilobum]|uniref:uncharacterized protein LOC133311166 n=1 Tax=Gastrolobium bilobum TaxID=150636 RepID=UPI002AB1A084|nr:uncharacterized protein LOC133311166 [Gastrolobium bilobum]